IPGPAGCAVPEVFARLGGTQMRTKAHVSCGLGIVRVRREDRLGVAHDGRSQPEPGGFDHRGRFHGSSETTTLPVGATAKRARGGTTRVEPSSSTTADPSNRFPTASRAWSYTIVSTNPSASGNQNGRGPLTAESARRGRPCRTTSLPATGARTATRTLMNSTGTSGGVKENFSRYAA